VPSLFVPLTRIVALPFVPRSGIFNWASPPFESFTFPCGNHPTVTGSPNAWRTSGLFSARLTLCLYGSVVRILATDIKLITMQSIELKIKIPTDTPAVLSHSCLLILVMGHSFISDIAKANPDKHFSKIPLK
jgi:hypothetical protein